jgi:hypothetical protein
MICNLCSTVTVGFEHNDLFRIAPYENVRIVCADNYLPLLLERCKYVLRPTLFETESLILRATARFM